MAWFKLSSSICSEITLLSILGRVSGVTVYSLYPYLSHWPGVGGSFPVVRRPSALRCSVISSENTFHGPDYPGRLHNYRDRTWSLHYTSRLKQADVEPFIKALSPAGVRGLGKRLWTSRVHSNMVSGRVTCLIQWWWYSKILSVSLTCCSTGPVDGCQVKL